MNLVLVGWGKSLADRVRVLDYEWLFRQRKLPLGSYIFTGVEQLSVDEREKAATAWRALAEAGENIRLFNHPLLAMHRYELLRTLCEAGLNPFDVYRLTEARAPQRFPVFLRRADDHTGPRSELLPNQLALEAAADDLVASGESRDKGLIVEFADTQTEDGNYRKYAAFFIRDGDGGLVIPRHVQTSSHWMVKANSRTIDEANVALERAYIETNPHADQIRNIFNLARIDFGRIDYGVTKDGDLVVFEINMNPQLVTPGPAKDEARNIIKETFAKRFVAALGALDSPVPAGRSARVQFGEGSLWRRKPFTVEIVMGAMARLRLHRHQPIIYARLMELRRKLGSQGR